MFYLTPFHPDFDSTYKVVSEACFKRNLRCTRGDEKYIEGNIVRSIIEQIMESRYVIANLNGRNPNINYELGIAQAIGKPVILIADVSSYKEIPFDLQSNRLLLYRDVSVRCAPVYSTYANIANRKFCINIEYPFPLC